ncbi:hypothetical protein LguiA_034307 [Lonicera macranthoides]
MRHNDEHMTFFIKVGSPGSAYASPVVHPLFMCACFISAQRQSTLDDDTSYQLFPLQYH